MAKRRRREHFQKSHTTEFNDSHLSFDQRMQKKYKDFVKFARDTRPTQNELRDGEWTQNVSLTVKSTK